MKGIDLFTKNLVMFLDLDELYSSPVFAYLEKVYGKIIFSDQANSGLLKVNKLNSGKIIISENCYYDYMVEGLTIGYLFPEKNKNISLIKQICNPSLRSLSKFGFILSHMYFDSDLKKIITEGEYLNQNPSEDLKKIKESHNLNQESHTNREGVLETYSYLNYPENEKYESHGYNIPVKLLEWSFQNKENSKNLLPSPWIEFSKNNDISVQRMITGNEIPRHTDTLPNGTDRHMLYSIHWITLSPFIGRELVVGKRTKKDLIEYLSNCLENQNNDTGYCSIPNEFEDTLKLKPEDSKGIYLNAFNPIFYHGVEKMILGDCVYTISDHFKI